MKNFWNIVAILVLLLAAVLMIDVFASLYKWENIYGDNLPYNLIDLLFKQTMIASVLAVVAVVLYAISHSAPTKNI
jgi:hypothetical protein